MKELWLMVFQEFGILDKCWAASRDEASETFKARHSYIDWAEADILSEADYWDGDETNKQ